ncbi:hypothetical protein pneo_cds_898 [Pandoravirus neocaledonia]|uniref:Ankyrin repeat domain containing protein n=1 Tax=Pandoravirus neocaledonia TaxID=2107708 RepID=A0A2U7UDS6_9VIRU|nr:hypothetical protein pneo_cds_898 [Pandoravirus neocaledonia]AVK76505.1 hypothetical protein pneo_cds_898 [Pandoravirus neocaledonia]
MTTQNRQRKPPALFSAADGARSPTVASDAEPPICVLPPELVSLVLEHVAACDQRGVSVGMCLLASRLFHVLPAPLVWRHGKQLRALSADLDALVAALPPYLCARLQCRDVLTARAFTKAAEGGNTRVVQALWHSGSRCYRDAHDSALSLACRNRHHETAAFLASVRRPGGGATVLPFPPGCAPYDDDYGRPTIHRYGAQSGYDIVDDCDDTHHTDHGTGPLRAVDEAGIAHWSGLIDEGSDGNDGDGRVDAQAVAAPRVPSKLPHSADAEGDLRLAGGLAKLLSERDIDPDQCRAFVSDTVIPCACHFVVMGHIEALALIVDRHRDILCAWARTLPMTVPSTMDDPSASLKALVADYIRHPMDSLVVLRRLMSRGDIRGVAALCERRRAQGMACDAGVTYNIFPFTRDMSSYNSATVDLGATRPCIDGDTTAVLAANARAFQLDVARAAGAAAYDSLSYIQAAAIVGAAATVDWALRHEGDKRRCVKATVRETADPSVVDVLVRHRSLADPVSAMVALALAGHIGSAQTVANTYPKALGRALDTLSKLSIERGDPRVVDVAADAFPNAEFPNAASMDQAAKRGPLSVLLAMARRGGARCTRQGVAAAMQRLHGVVMRHLYENRADLCASDAFCVRTRTHRRAWKRILDETAGAGYLDNARWMGQRLGIDGFRRASTYAAVLLGNAPALKALCAERVDCGPRAFTKAVSRGDHAALLRLIDHRPHSASTYAPVLAINLGRPALAMALIGGGCAVGADALIAAASMGYAHIVTRLLQRLALRRRTLNKALQAAARAGHTDIEITLRNHHV